MVYCDLTIDYIARNGWFALRDMLSCYDPCWKIQWKPRPLIQSIVLCNYCTYISYRSIWYIHIMYCTYIYISYTAGKCTFLVPTVLLKSEAQSNAPVIGVWKGLSVHSPFASGNHAGSHRMKCKQPLCTYNWKNIYILHEFISMGLRK